MQRDSMASNQVGRRLENLSESSTQQLSSAFEELRSSVRELRSDLEEQQEAMKLLQELASR